MLVLERETPRGKFFVTGLNRAANSLAEGFRSVQTDAKVSRSDLMKAPQVPNFIKTIVAVEYLLSEGVYAAIAGFFEIAAVASGGRRAKVPQT